MARVGARRGREGTIPRATAVPRLAKPARHAGYAPGAHPSIGGCRRSGEAASLRRAGQASHRGVGGAGVPRLSRRLLFRACRANGRLDEALVRALGDRPRPAGTPGSAMEGAVTGVDKAGIVARVARVLAGRGVNVTALSTQSRPEPETGTPIYTMRIRMAVPRAVDRRALRTELERVAAELRVELTLTERDSAE